MAATAVSLPDRSKQLTTSAPKGTHKCGSVAVRIPQAKQPCLRSTERDLSYPLRCIKIGGIFSFPALSVIFQFGHQLGDAYRPRDGLVSPRDIVQISLEIPSKMRPRRPCIRKSPSDVPPRTEEAAARSCTMGQTRKKRLGAGGRGNLFRIESPRIRKTATGPKIAKITILFSREIQCHSKRPHRGPVFKQGSVPSAPS